jgi:hypothetical protein
VRISVGDDGVVPNASICANVCCEMGRRERPETLLSSWSSHPASKAPALAIRQAAKTRARQVLDFIAAHPLEPA